MYTRIVRICVSFNIFIVLYTRVLSKKCVRCAMLVLVVATVLAFRRVVRGGIVNVFLRIESVLLKFLTIGVAKESVLGVIRRVIFLSLKENGIVRSATPVKAVQIAGFLVEVGSRRSLRWTKTSCVWLTVVSIRQRCAGRCLVEDTSARVASTVLVVAVWGTSLRAGESSTLWAEAVLGGALLIWQEASPIRELST